MKQLLAQDDTKQGENFFHLIKHGDELYYNIFVRWWITIYKCYTEKISIL